MSEPLSRTYLDTRHGVLRVNMLADPSSLIGTHDEEGKNNQFLMLTGHHHCPSTETTTSAMGTRDNEVGLGLIPFVSQNAFYEFANTSLGFSGIAFCSVNSQDSKAR